MEYRELDDGDERFAELVQYAFSPQSGPFDPAEYDPEDAPAHVGSRRGLFDGDDLVAICNHYWFDVDVRGQSVSAPGLSVVASPPEHRRGGNVGRLLEESLAEYRERGDPLSLLWPFSAPFYGQYGWSVTNRYAIYEVDPSDLAFATETVDASDATITFEQVDADDWAVLDRVDEATWTQTLSIDRSEAFWRHRVFESWESDPYVYVAYRDGAAVGYVVYYVRDGDDDGRRLGVAYFGAVDHDAFLAVLSFCHVHDSQVQTVRLKAPVDWKLEYVLEDPEAVETTVKSGPMARVVDAAVALEAVPYPNVDASVVLDVTDPLVDWHEDPLRLDVSGGEPTCERVPDATPDVNLGVGDLTQLVLGTRTASDLARTDDLEPATAGGSERFAAAVDALDVCFPPIDPCLLQFF